MAQNTLPTQTILTPLRERPERMAWLVILGSFAIFATLAVTLPAAWRYTVEHATVHQPARVEPLVGTLFVQEPRASEPTALSASRDDAAVAREDVPDGSRLSTVENAGQAAIKLLEADDLNNAFGTINLKSSTQVELRRLRRPLFERSTQPYAAQIMMDEGRIDISSNTSSNQRPLQIDVETRHGQIYLPPGSYRVVVTPQQTEVTVYEGRAELMHPEQKSLFVEREQRGEMTAAGIVSETRSIGEDLVRNGDFNEGLRYWDIKAETQTQTTAGQASQVADEGRNFVQLARSGKTLEERGHANEINMRQAIDQSVTGFDSLELELEARIVHQNLSGGGYKGTEFPLRVEIGYTDVNGNSWTWGPGFFLLDVDPRQDADVNNDGWEIPPGSQAIPRAQWEPYESGNLLEQWKSQGTPAARIDSIRIYASGHDYTSYVDNVRLVAK